MVELDGDDIRISSRGKLAERDIVQVRCFFCFQPFSKGERIILAQLLAVPIDEVFLFQRKILQHLLTGELRMRNK